MRRAQSKPLPLGATAALALLLVLAPGAQARTRRHHAASANPRAAAAHKQNSPSTPSLQNADAAEPPSAPDYAVAARVHAWVAAEHGIRLAAASAPTPSAAASAPTAAPAPANKASLQPASLSIPNQRITSATLKGSHDVLVHQNEMATAEGLSRIRDDADLRRMVAAHDLVPLPTGPTLTVDSRLPANRRYCRPWVADFLRQMAQAHFQRFHSPLQVNSAVRTVAFQQRLRRTNGNAAPIDGDTASPHLTGLAIDVAKKPMSTDEISWMRAYLLPLQQSGRLDVEEEFQQACFHLSVYRNSAPASDAPTEQAKPSTPTRPAPRRSTPAPAPAAAIVASIIE